MQCTPNGGLLPLKPSECCRLADGHSCNLHVCLLLFPNSSEGCCRAPPGKLSCRTGRVVAMLGKRHRQPTFVTMDTQITEGPAGQLFLLAQIRPWQGQPREEWGIRTEAVSFCILALSGCEASHSSLSACEARVRVLLLAGSCCINQAAASAGQLRQRPDSGSLWRHCPCQAELWSQPPGPGKLSHQRLPRLLCSCCNTGVRCSVRCLKAQICSSWFSICTSMRPSLDSSPLIWWRDTLCTALLQAQLGMMTARLATSPQIC